MISIFLSWIGINDLDYITKVNTGVGPLIALFQSDYSRDLDEIHLLYNQYRKDDAERYINYLKEHYDKKFVFHECDLENPTDYTGIYKIVRTILNEIENNYTSDIRWHFHTSPGTSQMSSIWLLLGKTKYPAILYQSHIDRETKEQHVRVVEIPFNIELEFIPDLKKKSDKKLVDSWGNIPEYTSIIHQSKIMSNLLDKAYRIALYDVPVLMLGETGTGKELFAKAIHKSSSRASKKMLTLNCAALQETTVNATLFGWSKGAWTGSIGTGKGLFQECDGGTLFLDEVGDLSPEIQTKLLRAIQEGEVQRVGDGKITRVDVRVIAATNKNLMNMVIEGTFREDLFHRLNVGFLKLPPLRERTEDISLISEHFLKEINEKFAINQLLYKHKSFSLGTKKIMCNYSWPGNIRELYHTIERACIWTDEEIIDEENFKSSITILHGNDNIGEMRLTNPVDLEKLVGELKKKYIKKALEVTNNNKSQTARLLGYKSYQSLTYDLEKLQISID